MGNCIYFVEGQCEERLISALKETPSQIQPGRVKVLNVIQEHIPPSQFVTIKMGTTVVLVFDTDVEKTEFLLKNIENLKKKCSHVKIIYLPQVLNLEEELVRCSDIKSVTELTHSKSASNFKSDFCSMTNVRKTLEKHNLRVSQLWSKKPASPFDFIDNNGSTIKI